MKRKDRNKKGVYKMGDFTNQLHQIKRSLQAMQEQQEKELLKQEKELAEKKEDIELKYKTAAEKEAVKRDLQYIFLDRYAEEGEQAYYSLNLLENRSKILRDILQVYIENKTSSAIRDNLQQYLNEIYLKENKKIKLMYQENQKANEMLQEETQGNEPRQNIINWNYGIKTICKTLSIILLFPVLVLYFILRSL